MEPKQIQMPDQDHDKFIEKNNANALSKKVKAQLSITQEKKEVPLDKFKWYAELYTNSGFYVILKIQDEPQIINNDWHFIPYFIEPDDRAENGGHKEWIQFFCVDEAKVLKKYTKKIKKYFPNLTVEWHPFDNELYQKQLEEINQTK